MREGSDLMAGDDSTMENWSNDIGGNNASYTKKTRGTLIGMPTGTRVGMQGRHCPAGEFKEGPSKGDGPAEPEQGDTRGQGTGILTE